jgi:hypothetical protein
VIEKLGPIIRRETASGGREPVSWSSSTGFILEGHCG